MASMATSALSIGQVDTLRKEKGQVIREVPMAVITVRQLQHICKGGSRRVVGLDCDGIAAATGKCNPLRRKHAGVQRTVREPEGVKMNWHSVQVAMSSATFLRPKISEGVSVERTHSIEVLKPKRTPPLRTVQLTLLATLLFVIPSKHYWDTTQKPSFID